MNAKPLVVLLAMLTGCAFGTNHVNLSPIPATASPNGGPRTQVKTRDARAETSGATVGFKRNGYGAKTGDVKLANDQLLADRLQGDVVSILRERGYRAGADDPDSELHCELEIVSFSVDVKQGFWSGALEPCRTDGTSEDTASVRSAHGDTQNGGAGVPFCATNLS